MKFFEHFWIGLFKANEDNVKLTWLRELGTKLPKMAKKIVLRILG
jgi:hypothetical protein